MKRLIVAVLSLALPLSLCACSAELTEAVNEVVSETKEMPKQEQNREKDTAPAPRVTYPEGFSVGFCRQSIAPEEFPLVTYKSYGYTATKNHDPLQLTCTALSDGENAALIFSVDIKSLPESFANYSLTLVERATGISRERIYLNYTHTHYGPDPTLFGIDKNIKLWQSLYYDVLVDTAILALQDLTPAEAFVGTAHTEGITFVRRYLLEDGTYKFNPSKADGPVAHESEADTQLRTIRFRREGSDDVVMVNYQTHYGGKYPDSVSADFIHPLREEVEAALNCNFIYINGASGNLNFMSAIPGERKYPTIYDAVPALTKTVQDAVASEKKVQTGALQWEYVKYLATTKSSYKKELPLFALSCGDLGFAGAPYEMFDTNGVEIREASPFQMTFICAYTNGSHGYVPSALAFSHGAYEVEKCQYKAGSGEEFARELVRLLKTCYEKGQE